MKRSVWLSLSIWLLALAPHYSSGSLAEGPLANYIIVSDIDDTIKWTHVLGPEIIRWGLNSHSAFIGMPELYDKLAKAGARIVYVTGFLDNRIDELNIPLKTIKDNHFPLKEDSDVYLHRGSESTENFKVGMIGKLMRDNSTSDFILIGDNGERDIFAYERTKQNPAIGSRVRRMFIHKIYSGGRSSNPLPDQQAYVTAAELAGFMLKFNYLDVHDYGSIVKTVHDGITNRDEDKRNLTLPFAANLKAAEVEGIYKGIPSVAIDDPKTQERLAEIQAILMAQAKKGPRRY